MGVSTERGVAGSAMPPVTRCEIPPDTLLARYVRVGWHPESAWQVLGPVARQRERR